MLGLPWHCHKKPLTGPRNQGNGARCFFTTAAPNTPDRLRQFTMTGRSLDADTTFEDMCVAFEQAYAQDPTGLFCECCQKQAASHASMRWVGAYANVTETRFEEI